MRLPTILEALKHLFGVLYLRGEITIELKLELNQMSSSINQSIDRSFNQSINFLMANASSMILSQEACSK